MHLIPLHRHTLRARPVTKSAAKLSYFPVLPKFSTPKMLRVHFFLYLCPGEHKEKRKEAPYDPPRGMRDMKYEI